jgi:dephospho-CoA kinase
MFRGMGAYILDADQISRDLVQPGTPALNKIIEEFGPDVLTEAGRLIRRYLAEIIFQNPEKRAVINAILHPRVFDEEERRRKEIVQKDPRAVILFDAALLIETGAHELMDRVILISVSQKIQVARLMERDHLKRQEALRRIQAQMPMQEKKKYADYIVDTSRSFLEVQQQVERIFKELRDIEKG